MAEREWRISSNVYEDDPDKILVRSRGSSLIPYIEIDLRNESGKIPLTEIGIGPGFSNSYTRQAVEDLCLLYGYSPQIYDAATPYKRQ
jgi:hypothetical protein